LKISRSKQENSFPRGKIFSVFLIFFGQKPPGILLMANIMLSLGYMNENSLSPMEILKNFLNCPSIFNFLDFSNFLHRFLVAKSLELSHWLWGREKFN